MQSTRRSAQLGTAGLEFALSTVFWVPLLLGTSVFGFSLIRAIQVTQITRDAAHMHAFGLDFAQTANRNVLLRLAHGLNVSATGGNGVFLISTVLQIGAAECTAAGLVADSANCPNLGRPVFTRRIVVGNAALRASDFGTPNAAIINSAGHITSPDYLTNVSARANGFGSVVAGMADGQVAYLVEGYLATPELTRAYYSSPGHYARSIF